MILLENSFGALKLVFSYDERSGIEHLTIDGEPFRHLFLSRRAKEGERFLFRNLREPFLYEYEAVSINKKEAQMSLTSKTEDEERKDGGDISLAWCVVDPKTIEKTIPFLNELGVKNLRFVYSDRSQKNFKIDMERIHRILINSCCQCGRNLLMNVSVFKNLEEFLNETDEFYTLDFGGESVQEGDNGLWLIGPEGGFSNKERGILRQKSKKTLSFKTSNILRSETAIISAATMLAQMS